MTGPAFPCRLIEGTDRYLDREGAEWRYPGFGIGYRRVPASEVANRKRDAS